MRFLSCGMKTLKRCLLLKSEGGGGVGWVFGGEYWLVGGEDVWWVGGGRLCTKMPPHLGTKKELVVLACPGGGGMVMVWW